MTSWGNLPKPPPRVQSRIHNARAPTVKPMTEFTYQDWTIYFQEVEPYTWYLTHTCVNVPVGMVVTDTPKFPVLDEEFAHCILCKVKITSEQFKVLRSTQKMLCRVARQT